MNDKSKSDEYPDRYVGDGRKVEPWACSGDGKRYPDAWHEAQAELDAMAEEKDEIESLEEIGRLLAWKLEQAGDETVAASVREKITHKLMQEALKDNERLHAERGAEAEALRVAFELLAQFDDDDIGGEKIMDILDRIDAGEALAMLEEHERELASIQAAGTRYMEEAELAKSLLSPLQKIAERMDGQDNRATADPIFIVQQRRRIYGFDTDWCGGNQAWLYEGSEVARTEEGLERFLYDSELTKEECLENGSLVEAGYKDTYEFVQPFFSAMAARNYIESNRHNLTDPRVYVDTAYRNEEWQAVRGVLLGMIEKPNADSHYKYSTDENELVTIEFANIAGHIDRCLKCGEENKFNRPDNMSAREFMDTMCGPGRKCPKCGASYDDNPERIRCTTGVEY